MGHLRFLPIFLIAVQCAAQSQENVPPAAAKISYVAHIPAQVMKQRPKTAITRFFGLTAIQGQKIALHFYDLRVRDAAVRPGYVKARTQVDIFRVSSRRNRDYYRLADRIPVTNGRVKGLKFYVEAFAVWLDPKRKTTPALLLRTTSHSEDGDAYQDSLLSFAKGFSRNICVSNFHADHFPGSGSNSIEYGPLDEKGFLTVVLINENSGDCILAGQKWNGQQFVEVTTQSQILGAGPYEWNGQQFIK